MTMHETHDWSLDDEGYICLACGICTCHPLTASAVGRPCVESQGSGA